MKNIRTLDNYNAFTCKCGNCRNTCCKLWHITLSSDEYFKMLSLNCNDQLKNKIDRSLSLISSRMSSVEKYAEIDLRYDGLCPFINDKGFCSIQCECGADNIPSICNNFPRSERQINNIFESALSCACEKSIEIAFIDKKLSIINNEIILANKILHEENLPENQLDIRINCISIMQQDGSFQDKFVHLYNYLKNEFGDFNIINERWDKDEIVFLNDLFETLFNKDLYFADLKPFVVTKTHSQMLEMEQELFNKHPQTKQYIENILVSHMFYSVFPFVDNSKDAKNSLIGLMTIYHIISYLFIMYFNDKDNNMLIDNLTFAFRTIEHTNFYHNCRVIYNKHLNQKQE